MAELKIENQAMMFAFLSRAAIEARGEEGREAIQKGMIRYGRERGARMADMPPSSTSAQFHLSSVVTA